MWFFSWSKGLNKNLNDGLLVFVKRNNVRLTEKNFQQVRTEKKHRTKIRKVFFFIKELSSFSMSFDQNQSDVLINLETILWLCSSALKKNYEKIDRQQTNLNYLFDEIRNIFSAVHHSNVESIDLDKIPIRFQNENPEIVRANSLSRLAQDIDLVQHAEHTMTHWIKQINRVRNLLAEDLLNFQPKQIKLTKFLFHLEVLSSKQWCSTNLSVFWSDRRIDLLEKTVDSTSEYSQSTSINESSIGDFSAEHRCKSKVNRSFISRTLLFPSEITFLFRNGEKSIKN